MKRQANIQKEEKRHAKRYLKRFVPELFNIPPQELSDEEEIGDRDRVGLFFSCWKKSVSRSILTGFSLVFLVQYNFR